MSFIDRALAKVGLAKRSIFSGAHASRITNDWVATLLAADAEIRADFNRLRARARELSRNNPVAKQYLTLAAANIVGEHGIRYRPQVRNNSGQLNTMINQKIERAWKDWCSAENCSVDGRTSFRSFQKMVVKLSEGEGEAFVRLLPGFGKYGLQLQLIEADRVDPL